MAQKQRLARYPPSSTESQWLFSRRELDNSPSIRQGMDVKSERRNRQRMIYILWQLRNLYRQPQVIVNTAAMLLQRFYMRVSFQDYDKRHAVAAAYFLASKVEDKAVNSKVITSILRSYMQYEARLKNGQPVQPDWWRRWKIDEAEYAVPDFIKLRKDILHVEETMLRMECFDMNLRHPHSFLGKVVDKVWNKANGREQVGARILDCGFCIANDTLAAPCCLLYRPQLIAACCFAIACVMLRQALPEKPLSVSEQRTLWEHDREEGEEETEESAFQAEHYWLEWLEVGSDELREPILFILDNWRLSQDSFVVEESDRIRPKVLSALEGIAHWPTPPASAGGASARGRPASETRTEGDVEMRDA